LINESKKPLKEKFESIITSLKSNSKLNLDFSKFDLKEKELDKERTNQDLTNN